MPTPRASLAVLGARLAALRRPPVAPASAPRLPSAPTAPSTPAAPMAPASPAAPARLAARGGRRPGQWDGA
ncbi:hypothetical protein CYJ26_07180 [Actinomyces urogenitalis]|uniref:Uncharacterized protein n=1 Tax=Actinomyces urogenitalis TaxID=103621 RepID=A0A2I1KSI7_9ACTO|nr:hypothetical protein CYJ26_07180 [Actinomyces urogenitalis]